MSIKLKDYGRNQINRKAYIHDSGLLKAGVDVSMSKNEASIGILDGVGLRGFRVPYHVNV